MKKNKKKNNKVSYIILVLFLTFVGISFITNNATGIQLGRNFGIFTWEMIKILPPAFILIGLFDVWAKRETIEKSFGDASGFKKYIWSVLLAATTVGGTFVAFPVAYSLYEKGAKYSSLFAYISSASLLMIPMTIMEASILGVKFSLIRIGVSIPLVILSSILLGRHLEKINYKLPNKE